MSRVWLWVSVFAIAAAACGHGGDKTDPATPAELTGEQRGRLAAAVSDARFKAGICVPKHREVLLALGGESPMSPQVTDALDRELTACEDWEVLADTLRARHARAPSDQLLERIAEAEIAAQRYDKAIDAVLPIAQRPAATPAQAWLAGAALYYAGRGAEARPLIEKAEPSHTQQGDSEPLELLGLIALDQDRLPDARALFEKAIATSSTTTRARQGLARTLARQGDTAKAEEWLVQARALQEQQTASEQRKFRVSAMSHDVQAAIDAGQNARAVQLLDEMIPIADGEQRTKLENFRASLAGKP